MKNKSIPNEFIIFSLIGVILLVIDFMTYVILYYAGFSIPFAKGIAYLFGTLVSFHLNKKLTFKKKYSNKRLVKFFILYGISFVVNITINSYVYNLFEFFLLAYILALFIAVVINFIGQKLWVFK